MRRALAFLFLVACGDSSTTNYGTKGLGGTSSSSGSSGRDVLAEEDGGTLTDSDGSTVTPGDADGDGTPDATDCDPASASLRRRVAEDALATDKGFFAAAGGFPTASWTHDGTAYRQTRLVDASDASLFVNEADVGDVQVEVRSASTETGALTPRLRQIFVVVGASTNGADITAYGCGIEVVEGLTPEQKTSIVKLAGPATNVTTTVLQRVTRPVVQIDEEFTIKLRLEDGAMSCDVTQGGATPTTTTATANGLTATNGRVGFFTRQTKALFKGVRICKLK